jgi:hypothetical protein
MARIIEGCTPSTYHGDPCAKPSFSSSTAKSLLKARRKAWLGHPKLGAIPRRATKAMDAGSIVNDLLLGIEGRIMVVDADDFKTKAAKEQRDAAVAAGKVPIVRAKYDEAVAVVDVLRRKLGERGVALSGRSEVAIEWDEVASGTGEAVLCRGQLDHLIIDEHRATIYDIKKIESAALEDVALAMVRYGHDIQWAAYTSAVEKLRPDIAGRVDFQFLFVELGDSDPEESMISPVRPDGAFREMGRRKWQRAVDGWAESMRTGIWDEYVPVGQVATVSPPAWALRKELEEIT